MGRKFRILVRKFEPFEIIVRDFWDQFKAKTQSDFELEEIALPLPELHQALLTGDFDVAHVNTDWLSELWSKQCLVNLEPYVDRLPPDDYPHGWSDSLLKLQTFPDGLAGIPFHDGPECLIYRKDLFASEREKSAYRDKYKVELEPPQTWAEFARVAEFFNRPEEKMYGTLFALYPDGHNNIFDFALQVWSRGGELTDHSGSIRIDSPLAIEAMNEYRQLIRQPFVHPESKNLESIGACWKFAQGEAAMMVNWFGFASMCETVECTKAKGCVDICPVPRADQSIAPVSLNVYYTWSVGQKSQYKDLAYDYIRNCVTRENDVELTLKGAIGCRLSTWFDEKVNSVIPYYSRMEQIHQYARTLPQTPKWNQISKIIDDMVVELVNTDKPTEEILHRGQSAVNKAMEVQ